MKLKYLLVLPLVAALTACSSDEPAPTPDGVEMPFYTTMSITLPSTGTRAENPVAGDEVGQDCENTVNSIQVVLTKRTGTEGNYKYEKVIASKSGAIVEGSTYTVLFDAKDLVGNALDNEGMEVYAFVICNDLGYDVDNFDIDKTFTGGALTSFSINQAAIRMTSAPYKAKLPKKSELLKHDTESKAYDLTAQVNGASGPIKVERSVARFDFKSKGEGVDANKFPIENGGVVRGHVQITDMALINENNEVYYFGRTNNDGLTTTSPLTHQLVAPLTNIGVTNPTSLQYVVCPTALASRTFNYSMSAEDFKLDGLSWTSISTLTQDDNHTGTWDDPHEATKDGYKIWRYCNENAIPASNANSLVNDNQKNRYTTGIVFKGRILNGTGDQAITGYGADELYLFRQTMYGDFAALYAAAYSTGAKANPDLKAAFEKTWELSSESGIFEVTVDGTVKKYALKAGQTRGGNGFTVYKNTGTQDDPVYPVYYYYWNRHDDNGQSNVMGPMEFSVVRNNVYKLSINSISMFGCSGTDDDPDKPDPDDPDETEHMYIKIDVQVMPWTVRLNGIDF